MRTTSQPVAPSPSAASLWSPGTVLITSRAIAETIGRIMIARISPAMKQLGIVTVPPPTKGTKLKVLANHCSAGSSLGARKKMPHRP